jgi:hypothetical protein
MRCKYNPLYLNDRKDSTYCHTDNEDKKEHPVKTRVPLGIENRE